MGHSTPAMRTARYVFDIYDSDGNGGLDASEIAAMLDGLDFEFDQAYIDEIVQQFGRPVDGMVGIDEFPALWDILGGEPLQPEPVSTAEQDALGAGIHDLEAHASMSPAIAFCSALSSAPNVEDRTMSTLSAWLSD